MTYVKQTWVNGASGGTPLSATRLTHIEDGIESVDLGLAAKADTTAVAAGYVPSVDTQRGLALGTVNTEKWKLRSRVGIGFPVPSFQYNGSAATGNTVVDIMPKGAAAEVVGEGYCWLDVCAQDCMDVPAAAVQAARVGILSTHVEFGSRAFNGAVVLPVSLTVGGATVLALGTDGNVTHNPGALNGTRKLLVNNSSTGSGAYTQIEAASGAQFLYMRAFSAGFTGDTNYASASDVVANGNLMLTSNAANVRIIANASNSSITGTIFQANSNGSAVVGLQAALATNATNGFVYTRSMAGTPSGAPTAITGTVPTIVDTTGSKLWAYIGGAWKSVTFA